jgi:hypothetical protein
MIKHFTTPQTLLGTKAPPCFSSECINDANEFAFSSNRRLSNALIHFSHKLVLLLEKQKKNKKKNR